MSEDLPNLGKLIKLLKMTTSQNDNEALLFVRKANEELKKFGGDWDTLLRGKVTVIGDPFVDVAPPPSRMTKTATNPAYTSSDPSWGRTHTTRSSTSRKSPITPPNPRIFGQPKTPSTSQFPPPPTQPRSNLYAGKCRCCGTHVPANSGILIGTTNGWRVECTSCSKGQTAQATAAPKHGRKRGSLSVDNLAQLMGDIP